MTEKCFSYQRNLPHWRMPSAVYYITWTLKLGLPELLPEERSLVVSAVKHFDLQRYKLYAYVVMNDHCHALLLPIAPFELQSTMYSWKSFTANQLQRKFQRQGSIWEREYFDRIVRNEEEFWQKMNYIITNPQRRWPDVRDYPWVEWFPADR